MKNRCLKFVCLGLLYFAFFGTLALAQGETVVNTQISETTPTASERSENSGKSIAQNIANTCTFVGNGLSYKHFLDGNYKTTYQSKAHKENTLEIISQDPMHALSLHWVDEVPRFQVEEKVGETWQHVLTDTNGFLTSFVPLSGQRHVRVVVQNAPLSLYELEVYGKGELPKSVQRWQRAKKADLLLVVAHPDDELIFMGGLIPYFAHGNKTLQVATLTHGLKFRRFELLNALWHCGLKNYPSIGNFKNQYTKSIRQTFLFWPKDEALQYVVNLMREFKPKVVVTHDVEGEYGHGAHKTAAYLCKESYALAADPEFKTGLPPWQVQKLYVHLGDNPTTMNWHTEVEHGKTAQQIAREAWAFHQSQQHGKTIVNGKLFKFGVHDDGMFNNSHFTLIESEVGEDDKKNDLFEHIVP